MCVCSLGMLMFTCDLRVARGMPLEKHLCRLVMIPVYTEVQLRSLTHQALSQRAMLLRDQLAAVGVVLAQPSGNHEVGLISSTFAHAWNIIALALICLSRLW